MIEEIKPNLFVQKTIFGDYKVVRPIKKDLSKPFSWDNINWKRLTIGSWSNFITLGMVLGVILLLAIAYNHDIKACRTLIETIDKDPCIYCTGGIVKQQRFVLPEIKGEEVNNEAG